MANPAFEDIAETFEFLEDWEDRYRHVIDMGKAMDPLPEAQRIPATKVDGCASQVWLVSEQSASSDDSGDPVLTFRGESDAHIVQGLVAILLAVYNDKRASEILEIDTNSVFNSLGLNYHLTPQRANGVRSMIARIRDEAAAA